MGYLMIGENERVDSIRKVVVEKYPSSSLAWDYYTGLVAKEKSKEEQVVLFEKALQHKTAANASSFEGMHQRLFEIYAETHNARALYHARYMTGENEDPYRPMAFKKIAQTLLDNNLALDTAAWYATRALSLADSFPVGVIRYFPETGYIYPYTSDSLRQAVYAKARGNMLSILGLINYKRGRVADANTNMDQAIKFSMDKETVDNAALFFRKTKQTARLQELQSVRMELMAKEVARKRLKVPAPSLRYFTTLDGKPVDTMALKNKIIVIDFWATWCVPCMEEMPYLQKLYDAYKSEVVFMVVNSGARNTLADAQKWNGNKKYTFPVYYNTDPAVGDKFKFSVIPATYVIGRDGNIAFSNIGFEGPDIEMKLKLQIETVSK
jgi:thiol-disulfide isomerase/thioredoxin